MLAEPSLLVAQVALGCDQTDNASIDSDALEAATHGQWPRRNGAPFPGWVCNSRPMPVPQTVYASVWSKAKYAGQGRRKPEAG